MAQDKGRSVYTTASAILALTPEQSSHGEAATIRGVITRSTEYGFALQDKTAGVWVFLDHPEGFNSQDEVEVTGIVHQGRFSPGVKPLSIHRLGHGPLPTPRAVSLSQLSTGEEDCQFVSVTGTVRSVALRSNVSSSQRLWLKLATENRWIYASLPERDAEAAAKLVDALVRIDAVAACTKNQDRQIIAATLMVPGLSSVTVLRPAPADLFSIPMAPIGRLMQYRSGTDYEHRVRVAGTVTYYRAGESLILEQAGEALYVSTDQALDIRLGDQVEAVGYPAPGTTGPILQDAVLRDMGHGDEVQAKSVSIADLSAGDFNDSFVSIEGRFLRRVEEPYRVVLLLQVANTLLLAELAEPESSKSFEGLKEGSRVRLSGISMLDADGVWNMDSPKASLIRYKLLLRSPADVQVTQPPSWWTINHVLYLALGFGVLALIFIGRDVYNRIEQWKRKAVLDERERMAFELHDTLAQSLAGIGFQLQAIRRGIPNEHPGLRQQVDVARALVQHSHKEARRTADPLGAEAATEIDLLSSLEECARAMVEGGSVEVRSASTGEKRPIPPPFRVGLLRIGQEAIANAVRHANPTKLEIAVAYSPACIRLSVLDDGCGFVKSGDLLGFGLRGMRKRAAALSARLEIESQPGAGTRVEVTAPLPPPPSISVVIKQSWKFIVERVVHVKADRRPDSNPHRG